MGINVDSVLNADGKSFWDQILENLAKEGDPDRVRKEAGERFYKINGFFVDPVALSSELLDIVNGIKEGIRASAEVCETMRTRK